MDERILDLIIFLKDKEYSINKEDEIIVWIDFRDLTEFTEIFGYEEFCEGGIEVTLLYESIAFNLYDLLYGYGDEEIEYIVKKLKQMEGKN